MWLTKQPFSSIVWPVDFWAIIDDDQQNMAYKFAPDCSTMLGIDTIEVSVKNMWKSSPPSESKGLALLEFLGEVSIYWLEKLHYTRLFTVLGAVIPVL